MSQIIKTFSLAPSGIKRKFLVAFALMSLLPMFVFGYLIVYYIFPTVNTIWDVSLIFAITIFLMLSGFYLAKKIIYPIMELTVHAKGIANGNLGEELEIDREDEIGELSGSLNLLSAKLKENMNTLTSYGEKIKKINMEINRKVFALSSHLQIGNIITASASLDDVLDLIVEKLSQLEPEATAFLMLLEKDSNVLTLRSQANISNGQLQQGIKIDGGPLGSVVTNAQPLIIDGQRKTKVGGGDLQKIAWTKNIAVLPVTSSGKVIGILGTGNNRDNFVFSDDELELLGVFAKQAAVAIENDMLMRRTEELTVKDELTGLYNESFIHSRLDEEIKRAISYQRPCSFIIFEVDNFKQYRRTLGEFAAEKALKKIAQTLKESTSDIDKVARFSEYQFALILPEKNKLQSLELSDNVRKEIERFGLKQENVKSSVALTLSGGISATPIDGTTALELIDKALTYIKKAKEQGANRILTS